MRLVIERGELLRALGHVTSVVERRTTIPILSNVLLQGVASRRCEFKATDLEREVIEEAPADVVAARRRDGAGAHAARHRAQAARRRQVEIKRDAEKERLTLAAGPVALRAADAAGRRISPISPPASSATSSRSPPHDLKRLIDKTRFAISTEETRYYLNGIYLHTAAVGGKADAARRGDRRPSPRAGRAAAARRAPTACRASSCRARPCTSCIA